MDPRGPPRIPSDPRGPARTRADLRRPARTSADLHGSPRTSADLAYLRGRSDDCVTPSHYGLRLRGLMHGHM
eukprot:2321442-Prymnesium_polylepis.1